MEVTEKSLFYLYCITNKTPQLKEAANLTDNLYCLQENGLYAVVSKVKESEFSQENLKKNLADFEWIKVKASLHEQIIEAVMKESCVMPFKLGTLFYTEDSLKSYVDQNIQGFKETLDFLDGKEEWGLKMYCDIAELKDALLKEDEEFLEKDKEISSASAGKGFFLKKQKEELLETWVNKKLNEYGQEAFESLREHSLQVRLNKVLPKEVTERNEDMILNAAFLVEKSQWGTFKNTAETLQVRYEKSGFSADCTGPWPPYNFSSVLPKEVVPK